VLTDIRALADQFLIAFPNINNVISCEDIQLEQDYPEETVALSQVWREKITIHDEEALPEAPTTPPNESHDD